MSDLPEPNVPLKRVEIAALCNNCNKEFELFKDDTGDPTLIWNWCPHCGEENRYWLRFLNKHWDLRPENRPPMALTSKQAIYLFPDKYPRAYEAYFKKKDTGE